MPIHTFTHQETAAAGTSQEVGRELGKRFAVEIGQTVSEYDQFFTARKVERNTRLRIVAEVSEQTRAWAPHLYEEMSGVAEGAGVSLDEIMILNARTEILAAAPTPADAECSTAALVPSSGAAPHTVQTWDWIVELNQELLVRQYVAASGQRVVTFSEFGQLGKIGVNSSGLGLHFNILTHTSDASQSGVPVHVVARRILDEARTVDDAIRIADSAPLAASTVVTVVSAGNAPGQPGEAASIELSPSGTAAIHAVPDKPLIHTNHFVDPELASGESPVPVSMTHERYACANDIAGTVMQIADPYDRAAAFTAPQHPVDVKTDTQASWDRQLHTKATIVLDLEAGALHFSRGSASRVERSAWQTFPMLTD